MKVVKNYRSDLLLLLSIAVAFIGFRLVTQAGQDMSVPQNDGYAITGGFILIISGVLFGLWYRSGRR